MDLTSEILKVANNEIEYSKLSHVCPHDFNIISKKIIGYLSSEKILMVGNVIGMAILQLEKILVYMYKEVCITVPQLFTMKINVKYL